MQRICAAPGGIKAYLVHPDRLLTAESRACPFCRRRHPLRMHGWYFRWALLPDPEPAARIRVRRLLCPATGRTVSLLPDFCLPRRQHGPAILGKFLKSWSLKGRLLLPALQEVRHEAAGHSVAQSLRDGFRRRGHQLRAYIARLRHRPVAVPDGVPRPRRSLAALVLGLIDGFRQVEAAFVFHGRAFQARFGVGLA